jgi:uncharacterized protein (TIGR03083 family)
VPACPGWDVGNVVAHIAYGALLFWVVPTNPALSAVDFGRLMAAAGDGHGVELFPGAMRALILVLRSHQPDDPSPAVVGEQRIASVTGLATTEVAVHLLDCQDALGRPRSMTAEHAVAAVAWTAEGWLPTFAAMAGAPPPGAVQLSVAGSGGRPIVGRGDVVAEVRGEPVEVLLHLWGRSSAVDVSGDADVVRWWAGLTARTTAVPARR